MTLLGRLIDKQRGDKTIEQVCHDCDLSRQTFLLLRTHGRIKLSTVDRLMRYFKVSRQERLELVRAWIIAHVGERTAKDLKILVKRESREGGTRKVRYE